MTTTIAVKKDTLELLKQARSRLGTATYDETIRKLIWERKPAMLSMRGALKHVKREFVREELDSWAWIEYLKNGPAADHIETYIKDFYGILMSAVNAAEVRHFILREGKGDLLQFIVERALVISVTAEIAQEAAATKVKRKAGLADAIVLATARRGDRHGRSWLQGWRTSCISGRDTRAAFANGGEVFSLLERMRSFDC